MVRDGFLVHGRMVAEQRLALAAVELPTGYVP
jgi:hypothetical protein